MITAEELGGVLFSVHDHIWPEEGHENDLGEDGRLLPTPTIYFEEDIIRIFKAAGLPEPDFSVGLVISLEEFENRENDPTYQQRLQEQIEENKKKDWYIEFQKRKQNK